MMQQYLFPKVYHPTLSHDLNHSYEISIAFKKYGDIIIFKDMCIAMEAKFRQYWRQAPLVFV